MLPPWSPKRRLELQESGWGPEHTAGIINLHPKCFTNTHSCHWNTCISAVKMHSCIKLSTHASVRACCELAWSAEQTASVIGQQSQRTHLGFGWFGGRTDSLLTELNPLLDIWMSSNPLRWHHHGAWQTNHEVINETVPINTPDANRRWDLWSYLRTGRCRGVPAVSSSQSCCLVAGCSDLQGLQDRQGPFLPSVPCPDSCPAWTPQKKRGFNYYNEMWSNRWGSSSHAGSYAEEGDEVSVCRSRAVMARVHMLANSFQWGASVHGSRQTPREKTQRPASFTWALHSCSVAFCLFPGLGVNNHCNFVK